MYNAKCCKQLYRYINVGSFIYGVRLSHAAHSLEGQPVASCTHPCCTSVCRVGQDGTFTSFSASCLGLYQGIPLLGTDRWIGNIIKHAVRTGAGLDEYCTLLEHFMSARGTSANLLYHPDHSAHCKVIIFLNYRQ